MPTSKNLVVFGPYEMPHDGDGIKKRFDAKEHGDEFWQNPELRNIETKHGVYIFALKAGPGFTPWYIGKTNAGFKKEIFTHHKVVAYNDVLWSSAKGIPVLFFIAMPDGKNEINKEILSDIEKELILYAYKKNSKLKNVHNTKGGPQWGIKGVLRGGKGKSSSNAKAFKSMMNI